MSGPLAWVRWVALLGIASLPPPLPGAPATVTPASPMSLRAAWEIPVEDSPAPFLAGTASAVVVAERSGILSAYDLDGSGPRWRIDLAGAIDSAPVEAAGRLAVLTEGGNLHLIDPASGDRVVVAGAALHGAILSEAGGDLAAADPAGTLWLIDVGAGAVRWRTELPSPPSAAAVRCGDRLLVGTAAGALVALAPSDGRILWRKKIGGPISTPVACEGKRGFVGSADNRLYAIKLKRRGCRIRWSYRTGADVAARPLIHDGRLYFFSYDTYLYAVDGGNGHLAWKVRLTRRPQATSALVEDLLLVAPLNSDRMEAFRLPDGAQTAAFSLADGADRFVTPPFLAGRLVVIAAARYGEESARVIALDPVAAVSAATRAGAGSSPPR